MKKNVIIIATMLLVISCGKNKKPHAIWHINNEKYISYNVNISSGNAITIMEGSDGTSHFNISMNVGGGFPQSGEIEITLGIPLNSTQCNAGFFRDGTRYLIEKHVHAKLKAYNNKGKSKLVLEPTLFINWIDTDSAIIQGTDSVIISGEFYE